MGQEGTAQRLSEDLPAKTAQCWEDLILILLLTRIFGSLQRAISGTRAAPEDLYTWAED